MDLHEIDQRAKAGVEKTMETEAGSDHQTGGKRIGYQVMVQRI